MDVKIHPFDLSYDEIAVHQVSLPSRLTADCTENDLQEG
jgi:hypothetical protein